MNASNSLIRRGGQRSPPAENGAAGHTASAQTVRSQLTPDDTARRPRASRAAVTNTAATPRRLALKFRNGGAWQSWIRDLAGATPGPWRGRGGLLKVPPRPGGALSLSPCSALGEGSAGCGVGRRPAEVVGERAAGVGDDPHV